MDSSQSLNFHQCLNEIRADLHFYGGKNFPTKLVVFLFSVPFKLMFWYRISRYYFLKHKRPVPLYSVIRYRCYSLGGNEFNFHAAIGKRIKLPHPAGIIIGAGVVIDDDVTIFQQVTFGSHGRKSDSKKYPFICSGAILYAGAKIIGGVTIGKCAVVAANSVVLQDVRENTMVAGVPATVRSGENGDETPKFSC